MGVGLGVNRPSRSSRRRGLRGHSGPISEINVTPLVDVMLVLLIVFMVAAPLLTVGVPVDLPESQAKSLNTASKPITVSITSRGDIYVGQQRVDAAELLPALEQVAVNGPGDRIYVRGDRGADYGSVMRVMGQLSAAGYTKIGLITAQEQGR